MRYDVHARMQHVSLLQRGSQRPMQAVLEIELAAPVHDMGEQVSVEGGVQVEQGRQVESVLRGDELVESDLVWRQLSPVSDREAMLRVGARVANPLEDHATSLRGNVQSPRRPVWVEHAKGRLSVSPSRPLEARLRGLPGERC